MPIGELAGGTEGVHQVGRDDEVAEPEGGGEDFAEGSEVDDAPLRIKTLQSF